MAQSNVIVRLSLKDADAVQRGLVALGADGEKALKRIEAAGRAPSAGLKALGAASDELKGKFGELSGQAGTVGTVLETLGPRGLLAAAGIGAVVVALGAAIRQADKAAQTFAELKDASERIGTSATALSAIEDVFTANASSAEEARGALEHLRATIAEAAGGSADAQKKFEAVGVSMDFLAKHGGDASQVLVEIAKNTDLTSSQVQDLVGRAGKGLVPALEALRDSGIDFNDRALDPMANALGELNDRSELLNRQFDKLGAEGAVQVKTAMLELKQALFDAESWFLRTAEAGHHFWEQVLDPKAWASLDAMRGTLRRATGLEAGPTAAEPPAPPASPATVPPAPMTISPPVDPNAAQKAQAVADKAAAQIEKEIAAIAKWKEAYLQASGDVEEALAARYQQEVRTAEAEIKDADRLAEAKQLIQATFAQQLEKIDRDKNQALAEAARELQEQLEKIDQDIAAEHIQTLRNSGRNEEAAREEMRQRAAEIETGGGTIDQQERLLANARLRIERELHDALTREEDAIGSARAQAARQAGNTIEALEIEHQQRLRQIRDSSYSTETRTALTQLEDEKSARMMSEAEQTRFTDWLGAQPPLIQDVADRLGDLGSSAADAFAEAVINGGKLSTVLEGLAADLQKVLLRMAMMKLIEAGANALTSSLTSTTTPTAGSGESGAAPGPGTGGLYARGAAFDAGNVIPFARGGVVDRPTLFPMARGVGLMGEAGPEGVLPLRRTASGDLGVAASGGAPKVTINVINNAGAKVTTEETKDGDGGLRIEVMIDAVEHAMAQRATRPGTTLNRALASAANPVRAR